MGLHVECQTTVANLQAAAEVVLIESTSGPPMQLESDVKQRLCSAADRLILEATKVSLSRLSSGLQS